MTTFQRILCPVDLSEFAEAALAYAATLARWYQGRLVVLSVQPGVVRSEADAETNAQIRDLVGSIAGGNDAEVLVTHGDVAREILRLAGDRRADVIVMGTHGRGGFERLILGSVTEKVLRKAECPVLAIVRPAASIAGGGEPRLRTIVCGVDRSTASRRALHYAQSLAEKAGGRLIVTHVLEDFSEEEERFARHFNTAECWHAVEPAIRADYEALIPREVRERCQVEIRTPRGKPYRELLKILQEGEADLLAVGTAGQSMLFGSTTNHVVREAPCPVLVVPIEAAPAASRDAAST